MAKCITIFFDGTQRRATERAPTNIVKLMSSVQHYGAGATPQLVIYTPGVGSGIGNTALGRGLDLLVGGVLGWGLNQILERVYLDLITQYEPGDEIMIFGYSRGAFAARAFVGLLRVAGIPPRRHMSRIPEAVTRYIRSDGQDPDGPELHAFRQEFAPYTATSVRDLEARRRSADDSADDCAILLDIAYVGVLDTVRAMPLTRFRLVRDALSTRGDFGDTSLDPMVRHARHAMALDEDRRIYSPTPWSAPRGQDLAPRVLQRWFAGDHGMIGGGGGAKEAMTLGAIAVHWIVLGAQKQGLAISWLDFDHHLPALNLSGQLRREPRTARFMGTVLGWLLRRRSGPGSLDQLSMAVIDRLRSDASYRPASLSPKLREAALAMTEPELETLRRNRAAAEGGQTHDPGGSTRPGA